MFYKFSEIIYWQAVCTGVEPTFKPQPQSTTLLQQKPEQLKIIEHVSIPKEPPTEFEFIIDPPSISAFDL